MTNFSILIPTYNGQSTIGEALVSISNLIVSAGMDYEVIVLSNGSTDQTIEVAEKFAGKFLNPLKYRVISLTNSGKSDAIFKGIELSKYEFVIICDDDNFLEKNYLINAARLINGHPDVNIWGGYGVLNLQLERPAWFNKLQFMYAIGSQGDFTEKQEGYVLFIWGAGMIIRKSFVIKLLKARFTPLLGRKCLSAYIAGEDAELSILNRFIGGKLFYSGLLKYEHKINPARFTKKGYHDLIIRNTLGELYLDIYKYYYNTIKDKKAPNFIFYFLKILSAHFYLLIKYSIIYISAKTIKRKEVYFSKSLVMVSIFAIRELIFGFSYFKNSWEKITTLLMKLNGK